MILNLLSGLLFAILTAVVLVLAVFHPTLVKPDKPQPSDAKRVVMMDNSLSGYVTVNDGTDHVIAVPWFVRNWASDGILNQIYPELEKIPLTGNSRTPDPEQLLYLQADAIFAWRGHADTFKATGLPGLMELWVDPKDPIRSRERVWLQMGKVTGKSARANALLDRWAALRTALCSRIPREPEQRVKVAWIHVFRGDWYTTNASDVLAYKIELAGGMNVGKNVISTGKYDLEQLLLLDPDVILFGNNPDDHTTLREIAGRSELQSLRAVREHRVYKIPLHSFMNEPFEDLFLLPWMAEVFYPDRMPHHLRDDYRQAFWEVYHYAISDDEIDKAIYLDENRNSAGYGRFARPVAAVK